MATATVHATPEVALQSSGAGSESFSVVVAGGLLLGLAAICIIIPIWILIGRKYPAISLERLLRIPDSEAIPSSIFKYVGRPVLPPEALTRIPTRTAAITAPEPAHCQKTTPRSGISRGKTGPAQSHRQSVISIDRATTLSRADSRPVSRGSSISRSCAVCLEEYAKKDTIRTLPCQHEFHKKCIDRWLLGVSATCPLCKLDVLESLGIVQLPAEEHRARSPDPTPSELESAQRSIRDAMMNFAPLEAALFSTARF
ncbi:hypothetical protein M427DRAFT_75957 [Gonapodya prolifera JEL478]|uniref:RING-type domain-containing protein n=1 Tax=Gonapodya prolifera (strain JEL478) TaxID=1344416 RepID=A0A138ZX79_GONPJ|nr:hypothetical protein M427DRAFT_75957 [Gonapodya prolifera JEL478]|eukprot:KXS09107.1 hypothetical protein M427DRAFT_75957 [Gonapodya prolifera JEL478]